jgi:hypothetical protein
MSDDPSKPSWLAFLIIMAALFAVVLVLRLFNSPEAVAPRFANTIWKR